MPIKNGEAALSNNSSEVVSAALDGVRTRESSPEGSESVAQAGIEVANKDEQVKSAESAYTGAVEEKDAKK